MCQLLLFVLTADSDLSQIELPRPDDPVLLAALAALAVWSLLLTAFIISTRAPRVEAAAPTMDLGPEPPAVVNLLVDGARVTPNALQATLFDLAARGFIEIEEYDAGRHVICRISSNPPHTDLETYAKIVLDHVKDQAVDGVVVAQALTTGTKRKASAWWKSFRRAVVSDAQARGLTENRWGQQQWGILRLAGLAAGGLFVLVAARANALEPGAVLVLLAALSLNSALIWIFGDQRLRQSGLDEAAHWLGVRSYLEQNEAFIDAPPGAVTIWERYMGYAAAMGLATRAIRALPMGAEDDRRAWSAYGGEWREVRVAYPRSRIIWGRSPLGGLMVAAVIIAVGCGVAWLALQVREEFDSDSVGVEAADWVRLGTLVAIGCGGALAVLGAHTLALVLLDFSRRTRVTGEIVRLRSFKVGKDQMAYFMALYDGKVDRIRAWRVPSLIYNGHLQGEVIQAFVSPHLGYVHKAEPVPFVSQESPPAHVAV